MNKATVNFIALTALFFVCVNFVACSKSDPSPAPPAGPVDPCAGKIIVVNTTPTASTACASAGSIVASATGSTNFTYKLNSVGVYQASGTFSNLSAGDYTIFAKDGTGCEKSAVVTVASSGTIGAKFTAVKSLIASKCQSCHNNAVANGGMNYQVECNISGIKQLYGLDNASMRMSFDYGITDNTTIGFGRSTFRKELDLFVKTRIFQQSTGQKAIPFSLVIAAGGLVWTEESFATVKPVFSDRTSYYVQLIAGRKFSQAFSFQLSPILVHSGILANTGDDETIFAMGGGVRLKVSKRMAITLDYHHPFGTLNDVTTDPLSLGVDIETGGHVFQLQFSNATDMNERAYITQTTGDFFKGDIRFGFNLSRIFKVGKR